MDKKIFIILGLVIVLCATGVYRVLANQNKEVNMNGKKILIAYFSHSGNTRAVAEKIQGVTGGDLFEIKPAKPYPAQYNAVVEIGRQEKENNVYPELTDNGNVENNFDGKTIAPFCTHGGGGASSTYTDMQKLAPNAVVTEGFTSYENSAKTDDVKNWINSLKF